MQATAAATAWRYTYTVATHAKAQPALLPQFDGHLVLIHVYTAQHAST